MRQKEYHKALQEINQRLNKTEVNMTSAIMCPKCSNVLAYLDDAIPKWRKSPNTAGIYVVFYSSADYEAWSIDNSMVRDWDDSYGPDIGAVYGTLPKAETAASAQHK